MNSPCLKLDENIIETKFNNTISFSNNYEFKDGDNLLVLNIKNNSLQQINSYNITFCENCKNRLEYPKKLKCGLSNLTVSDCDFCSKGVHD